jgi:hypothetical protein
MGKGLINRILAVGVLPLVISFICLASLMFTVFLMGYGAYWLYFNIMR